MTNRPRPVVSLPSQLRLLVALIVLATGVALGGTVAEAGNGVAAINLESAPAVGAGADIPAGHVGSDTLVFDDGMSGCCVAPSAARFCSLSGETEVLMADGTTKPIAEVEVGDLVLAEDPETGERGARVVTHLWVHEDTIVDLEIDGHDLATTEDHSFWNDTDSEWQRADALDLGVLVLTASGATLTVDGMDWGSARTTTAYNLTVDDIHTYFVLAGDDPLLVHNTCWKLSPPAPDTVSKGVHFTIDGVELAARPGNGGSVVFRPVFSSTSDSAANAAIRQANNALATDTQFQTRLLANAERSLEYLQGNSSLPGATGRQAEVNFLIKSLGG